MKALIDAATSGKGYVEYYWDDPSVEGDEDIGSAKVGYTESFTFPDDSPVFAGQTVIFGSGFYKGNRMALDFAHFGNGDSFSSDVVLVNLAATPIRPFVYFYDTSGELIDPGSLVDVMGNSACHGLRRSDPPVGIAVPGRSHHFDQRYGRPHDRFGESRHRGSRQPHRRSPAL